MDAAEAVKTLLSPSATHDPVPAYAALREHGPVLPVADGYRNAGQCSGLQAGGEGPRSEGRRARAVP
ncbi:hypothetical protein ACQPZJ_38975 [Actinoplanes sp. CA-054009]